MRQWLDDLEDRTQRFGIDIVNLAEDLEAARVPNSVIWQLTRAGTSVAANHRACRRARNDRELLAKLAIVDEEADEAVLWLELVSKSRRGSKVQAVAAVFVEATRLRGLFSASRATVRRRVEEEDSRKQKR